MWWVAVALAAEPPAWPDKVEPADGVPDCPMAVELRPGEPWTPPEWLVRDGVVQCRAVVEPHSSLANLLNIESSYRALRAQYRLDTMSLELQLEHYQERARAAEASLVEPAPFWSRPENAAWRGRIEVAAVVALTAWSLGQLSQ